MAHLYDVFLSMKEVRGCVELEREKGEDVKSIIRTFERVEHLKCRSFYITGRFKIYQMPEITHTLFSGGTRDRKASDLTVRSQD